MTLKESLMRSTWGINYFQGQHYPCGSFLCKFFKELNTTFQRLFETTWMVAFDFYQIYTI